MQKNNKEDSQSDMPEIKIEFSTIKSPGLKKSKKENIADNCCLDMIVSAQTIVVPGLPQPIKLESDEAIDLATRSEENQSFVVICFPNTEGMVSFKKNDLYPVCIVGKFGKVIKLPDGSSVGFFSPYKRASITKIKRKGDSYSAEILILKDIKFTKATYKKENVLLQLEIDKAYSETLKYINEEERNRLKELKKESDGNPVGLNYALTIQSPLTYEERLSVIGAMTFTQQQEQLLRGLDLALQRLDLQSQIAMRTHQDMSRQQKEMFLRSQIKMIEEELGKDNDDSDIGELKKRASQKLWKKEVENHFNNELKKLERLFPASPDYSVQYNYLDTLLNLPWDKYDESEISIPKIEETLEKDHYGLEDVKERIVEHMAITRLRNDLKAPILCLAGPPGIGKTSLGKSIAESIGREYKRIALGGLHDEAEIRGHRRTYIGAMPGRIMSALSKCKTGNPVIVLDEIDKIAKDYKGDPSTALLELLDPEQNSAFHDNYIDVDYDLSKVLFLATANSVSDISRPLLDRMELIEISGYSPEEKIEIALRHLIKKAMEETGMSDSGIEFTRDAISMIISSYTRESGVRQLEKKISKILRKVARLLASGKDYPKIITKEIAKELLGKEDIYPTLYDNNDFSGVVTGLAWTQTGGDILFIETSISKAQNEKLTLTGNLGDVMKESAVIALQLVKTKASFLNIQPEVFESANVHIHVPEGAIPKDGPSAGITMVVSIASAFTGRRIRKNLAMSGEITLRGKILPVGGIKEKVLAARRAGISDIILPSANERDVREINPDYIAGVNFHYFDNADDALGFALLDELAPFRLESINSPKEREIPNQKMTINCNLDIKRRKDKSI